MVAGTGRPTQPGPERFRPPLAEPGDGPHEGIAMSADAMATIANAPMTTPDATLIR
jgi:hypothetical protein